MAARRRNAVVAVLALVGAAAVAWQLLPPDRLAPPAVRDAVTAGADPASALPETARDDALCDPRSPGEARQVVAFARNATEVDVPRLRRMALASDNPLVAGNALRALGRLRAVAADDALLGLRHDPRPRVRQELVVALGASGDPRMVAPLVDVLETADPALRPLVLQALGALGGTDAHHVLRRVVQDPRAAVTDRAFARQALDGVAMRSVGNAAARTRVR